MTFDTKGFADTREVLRLKPDGTYWIAPDITDGERAKVFENLVKFAAEANKAQRECENQHKS